MNLYQHQKELLERNPHRHGIFFEMGAGKSLTAIKLAEKNVKNCLVICPKSLVEQWNQEIQKFKESDTEFTVIHKEKFKKYAATLPRYEAVIVDEAHFFAGYKSQLHKTLISYFAKYETEYRWLLTGTPMMSTCWSIYSLGKLLGKNWNWYEWRTRYFSMIKMGNIRIPKQKNGIEHEMKQIVSNIGTIKRLDELADIPEQTDLFETFDLNKIQKHKIENLIDVQPIVRFTKIHQIESGVLKGDEFTAGESFSCTKTDRVLELCAEHKKIAVVCRYNLQIEEYAKQIKKKCYIINGKTENKNDLVNEINDCEECVVLINSACSVGYNLWSVPVMIFASLDFSYLNYAQIKGRLLRMNHLKKNVYIHLITSGHSIDKAIMECLEKKEDFNAVIYDRRKNIKDHS